jgi:periplasmic mercuric ion binding protein
MTARSYLAALSLSLAALAPQTAAAESRIVVLSVPDMVSAECPILTRKALQKVAGVEDVKASLERKEAVVVFDAGKTNVDKLVQATKNAGFPKTHARP